MSTSPRTILLVEDNPDDEALTMRALSRHNLGHHVTVVRDGQEAVDWLDGTGPHHGRDGHDLPALILLDLKLPKVDGLDVLRRLRANPRTSLIPVVILTSSKEDRDRASSYQSGANSYVQKPVDFSAFLEAVRQLAVYWLVVNEPPPGRST